MFSIDPLLNKIHQLEKENDELQKTASAPHSLYQIPVKDLIDFCQSYISMTREARDNLYVLVRGGKTDCDANVVRDISFYLGGRNLELDKSLHTWVNNFMNELGLGD